MRTIYQLISFICFVILTSCGGGGGGSDTAQTVSGKAIDGYLYLAKVCLDLNDNLKCDAGEPTTTTDIGGNYNLTGATSAQLKAHSILVVATAGITIDASNPGTPVVGNFTMTAPPGFSVVTPITTLVVAEMIANNLSLGDAQSKVLELLDHPIGVSANDLITDFIMPLTGNPKVANLGASAAEVLTNLFLDDLSRNLNIETNYYKNLLSGARQYITPHSTAIQNATSQTDAANQTKAALLTGRPVSVTVLGLPLGQSLVLLDTVTVPGLVNATTNILTVNGGTDPYTPVTANFSIPIPTLESTYVVTVYTQPTGTPSVSCSLSDTYTDPVTNTISAIVLCEPSNPI
jgi:hypothetical protein